jgi:DnaK suppressor protein
VAKPKAKATNKKVIRPAPAPKKKVAAKSAAVSKQKSPPKAAKKKVTVKPAKVAVAKKKVAPPSAKPAAKNKAPIAPKSATKKAPPPPAPVKAPKAPALVKPAPAAPVPTPKAKQEVTKKPVATKTKAPLKPAPSAVRKVINLDEIKLPTGYRPSANDEYMSAQHLAYFRQKLQNWRQELILESQETLEHLRTETRDVGDEAERASRESDNILELRTRDRYRKLLNKIEQALKRIEEGNYGYCEETGEEIGLGRLEARPIATLTVDAQERRELLQRQFRDDH